MGRTIRSPTTHNNLTVVGHGQEIRRPMRSCHPHPTMMRTSESDSRSHPKNVRRVLPMRACMHACVRDMASSMIDACDGYVSVLFLSPSPTTPPPTHTVVPCTVRKYDRKRAFPLTLAPCRLPLRSCPAVEAKAKVNCRTSGTDTDVM